MHLLPVSLTRRLQTSILHSMTTNEPITKSPDLSVDLAGLAMKNPIMTASGTSGYGPEYEPVLRIDSLGAFVTKAVTPLPRRGNKPPRVVETPGGMINAIGLANVGMERFIAEKVPYLSKLQAPVIVNVAGHSVDDYLTVCVALDKIDCIAGLELNVSCPNVSDGLEFGTDAKRLRELVAQVRSEVKRAKLIVKVSPNVTDVNEIAAAAVDQGADALSVINTLRAMAIDVDTRKPMIANRCGGLSGPAIKPVALFMVNSIYNNVAKSAGVPIIGMGGIATWQDAVEFMLAGATAVAVGTSLFVDPTVPTRICAGLTDYLQRKRVNSIRELTGALE